MILLRGLRSVTGSAVQITTLLVGKLLLARLEPRMVARLNQASPDRRCPLALGARLHQRVSHRRQLIAHGPRHRLVDLGVGEVVLGDLEEPRSHAAAPRCGIAGAGPAGGRDDEDHECRMAYHPRVFASARARVKPVRRRVTVWLQSFRRTTAASSATSSHRRSCFGSLERSLHRRSCFARGLAVVVIAANSGDPFVASRCSRLSAAASLLDWRGLAVLAMSAAASLLDSRGLAVLAISAAASLLDWR